MNARHQLIIDWLNQVLPTPNFIIEPASADASFRRYFRIRYDSMSRIVMDAPPDKEDCRPFVAIAEALCGLGLNVPRILEADLERGLLLLTDLGTRLYLAELNEATVDALYADALESLARLQTRGDPEDPLLPAYDRGRLVEEMDLIRPWFLERHLQLSLSEDEHRLLDQVFALLCDSALEQPRVWVHRDYHSRNLMVTPRDNPGVLDFQDAVVGPITYDLVSLLRDCYIVWPRQRVDAWALRHRARLLQLGLKIPGTEHGFLRWFDLMGVQRHIKVLGIFSRLYHRDGKPGYLRDLPLVLHYTLEAASRYPELAELHRFLRDSVTPAMEPLPA